MKNTIKMSLVAAVAVAGLSSTASAQPLEEAIKNVDISGSMVYRYNDYGDDKNLKNKTDNNYKVAVSLKSKVNDYITATVRVVAGDGFQGKVLSTKNENDKNLSTEISNANFTLKTDYATVIAGKQGLTTPWTVAIDSDGNEQTGTGLLALVPAGPVTFAAAYFNQTNLDAAKAGDIKLGSAGLNVLDGSENIATVGVLGNAGPVALDAWYLDADDVFDSFTIGAKTTIDMITAELRYASLDLDNVDIDNNIIIAKLAADVDIFNAYLQYGKTDKEGGITALDNDAKTTMTGWNTNVNGKADADYWRVGAGMDVMSNLNVSINYADLDYKDMLTDNDKEENELYTQITHKMGKNLTTYVRLGTYEVEEEGEEIVDATAGRLQIAYTF
ncbi:MAG: major outer membrane protein [Arcobacteraceae bacterium]